MLFNSWQFLLFFPVVCLGYYLVPEKLSYLFLLFASYFFYMCWNPKYALLLFASTFITYVSGILIGKWRNRRAGRIRLDQAVVAVSFTLNLSILFFFKYFDFLIASINRVLAAGHIQLIENPFDLLLPVGISFYIFQALSYTVDVYREEIYCEKNLLRYALFVSFFPQLVAGPIERSKNLLRQLSSRNKLSWDNVQTGLIQMGYGFFQKLVISDNASVIVDAVFDQYAEHGTIELVLAALLFAVQIYCDFAGYSNIAIGAAKVMGIRLMKNFDTPYYSVSVAEFWRRWHISLSSWFRDYLYIPLGGNRKGKIRKYCNIMIVFLASGLWHGASWNYVIWGGLNGLYQLIGDVLRPVRDFVCRKLEISREAFSHKFGKGLITFVLIDFSWIFFRAPSSRLALQYIRRIFTQWDPWVIYDGTLLKLGLSGPYLQMLFLAVLVLGLIDFCSYRKMDLIQGLVKQGIWFRFAVYLLFLFWILFCGHYGPSYDATQFIYFQF